MVDYVNKLVSTVHRTKNRVIQQSKQRRGGITDLYAIDYVSEVNNPLPTESTDSGTENSVVVLNKGEAVYRVPISSDLDRLQRWFLKVIVESKLQGDSKTNVQPLADVHLTVSAQNQNTGATAEIDLTEIFKRQWSCNWIGDDATGEGIFPNNKSNEGFDLMYSAWYLNDKQREALFSAGEKIFRISAIGVAKVTLRNFIKFSHIN